MDADPLSGKLPRLTEQAAARDPAAVAGRQRLELRLARLTPRQRDAFREAVRRCYASAAGV